MKCNAISRPFLKDIHVFVVLRCRLSHWIGSPVATFVQVSYSTGIANIADPNQIILYEFSSVGQHGLPSQSDRLVQQ